MTGDLRRIPQETGQPDLSRKHSVASYRWQFGHFAGIIGSIPIGLIFIAHSSNLQTGRAKTPGGLSWPDDDHPGAERPR